jgi:hypothetical protein
VTPPAPPTVCRLLRARGAYGRSADGSAWQSGDSSVEAYWCLATMEPVGPDDALVHAHACRAGRGCFAPSAERRAEPEPGREPP